MIPTETKRITAVNLEILQIETFVPRLWEHLLNISCDNPKIPKISPGAYIFQRPFSRGLSREENLRFKIDWASLIVRRKFTGFALFYFLFEGNFQVYLEGRFNKGFFALRVWGAYIWRGLHMEGLIFRILRYFKTHQNVKCHVSPHELAKRNGRHKRGI